MSKFSLQCLIAKEFLREKLSDDLISIIFKMVDRPLYDKLTKELKLIFLFLLQDNSDLKLSYRDKFYCRHRLGCNCKMRSNISWFYYHNPEYINRISVACNCCKRHQKNKAEIDPVNGTFRIITKPIVNNPDFVFPGSYRISASSRGKFRREFDGGLSKSACPCNCRSVSRHSVRNYMRNLYGKNAMDGERMYLGIPKSEKLLEDESNLDSLNELLESKLELKEEDEAFYLQMELQHEYTSLLVDLNLPLLYGELD